MRRSGSGSRSSSKRQRKQLWKTFFTKRTLVISAMLIAVGSGLAGGIWLYRLSSGFFPVKEISFSGNVHMSDGDLRSLMAVPPHEGLLRLSAKGLSTELLKSPWIKDASVRKEFPCRISVRVHEVSPFAILEMRGRSFLIDEKGKVLDEMKSSVPFLPVITADPFKNRDIFMDAIRLAGVLKEKRIATERNRVEIIAGKSPESISMILDNVLIKVGQGDYEQKLNRLFELENEIKRRAIAVDYVDLRFADRVVVKPISEVVR